MLREHLQHVDILILGAGWTSTFLIPYLQSQQITYAATTTTGRDGTIPFKFSPDSGSADQYTHLPSASTVLITFPLKGHGQSKSLVGLYRTVHGAENKWVQLGATSIWKDGDGWTDDSSPYNHSDPRAIAEDELRSLGGVSLNLSGLYGGSRVPAQWLPRIITSKEDVKKRGAVHFVHGEDVARVIVAVHRKFEGGKRWIVSDMRVYDWWDLIMSFSVEVEGDSEDMKATKQQYAQWVGELMLEENVRALPREMSVLGRKLDSRGFWKEHGIWPRHQRLA